MTGLGRARQIGGAGLEKSSPCRRLSALNPKASLSLALKVAERPLFLGCPITGETINMDLNVAAFAPSISLREVMSHACIRFPLRPVLVHA